MAFTTDEVRRFRVSSYAWGLGFTLVDGAAYLISLYGAITSSFWLSQFFWSVAAGFCASGLFVVGHDAAHNSLTPSRLLNRIVGTIVFLPLLHNYSLWRYTHNIQHHLHTNQRGKDFVWEPLSPREYWALNGWSRAKYRFFRSGIGHYFYYIFEVWAPRRIIPRRAKVDRMRYEYWIDTVIVAMGVVGLSAAVIWLRARHLGVPVNAVEYWVQPLVMGVVLPFFVGNMLQSHTDFVQHTHPAVHWFSQPTADKFEEHQTKVTIHVRHAPPVDWFLHWIQDHTAHHLQPAIPLYRLKDAQAIIDERHEGEVVAYRYGLRAVAQIINSCKLYDDEVGTWTDFAGNPTSPPQRSSVEIDDSSPHTTAFDGSIESVAMTAGGQNHD